MTTPGDVDRAMQQILDTHLDAHSRELVAAWSRAWTDVETELRAAVLGKVAAGNVPDADPIDPARLRSALRVIEDRLTTLAGDAATTIGASAPQVVALGADGELAMAAASYQDVPQKAEVVGAFARADPEQLDAIVTRTTQAVSLTASTIPADTAAAIRRRLVRGVAVGDNPRLVAEQIMLDAGHDFNGGLARALNISRTEMLTAMRDAQWATDQANKGVLRGWRWTCHADSRTCRSCLALDGTEYPVEEEGPIDHHSGRCARVPLTKSWADLGIPGVPEPTVEFPDVEDWFEGQDEATQRSILSPRGFDAWKRGDYPMSAWAERRENPGWRDTMVPSRPPK